LLFNCFFLGMDQPPLTDSVWTSGGRELQWDHVCCQQIQSKKRWPICSRKKSVAESPARMRHPLSPIWYAQGYTAIGWSVLLLWLAQMWSGHVPPWACPQAVQSRAEHSSSSSWVCTSVPHRFSHYFDYDFVALFRFHGAGVDGSTEGISCYRSLVCCGRLHAVVFQILASIHDTSAARRSTEAMWAGGHYGGVGWQGWTPDVMSWGQIDCDSGDCKQNISVWGVSRSLACVGGG
jgi:hypothetical protein